MFCWNSQPALCMAYQHDNIIHYSMQLKFHDKEGEPTVFPLSRSLSIDSLLTIMFLMYLSIAFSIPDLQHYEYDWNFITTALFMSSINQCAEKKIRTRHRARDLHQFSLRLFGSKSKSSVECIYSVSVLLPLLFLYGCKRCFAVAASNSVTDYVISIDLCLAM